MKQIKTNTTHKLSDSVSLNNANSQIKHRVSEIRLFEDGSIMYGLTQGGQTSFYQEAEINN